MKMNIVIVGLLVLCAGCLSDGGIYSEKVAAHDYNPASMEIVPRFNIEDVKHDIADLGREGVLGKWRLRLNRDQMLYAPGNKFYLYGASCQWENDIYEFKDDGSYSMRRLSKDGKTVLFGSGEDGQWTYANGILRIRADRRYVPGMFSFSEVKRTELKASQWLEFKLRWHSDRMFTVEYNDLDAAKMYLDLTAYFDGVPSSLTKIRYDDKGCLHGHGVAGWGCLKSEVMNPMRFKRVDK